MRYFTNLVCLVFTILGANTASARKEINGEQIQFFSEKDLRVFIKEKSEQDGVCRRKIQFTYGQGGNALTQDNVYVACYDTYDEYNDGNKYIISRILYSENPQTVIVISPKGNCKKFFYNNGALGGPETINGMACKMIKMKIGGGVLGKVMGLLSMSNPSGSGSESKSLGR